MQKGKETRERGDGGQGGVWSQGTAKGSCPMCGANVSAHHYVRDRPLLGLFQIAYHTRLGIAIRDFCPRCSVNTVHPTGLLIWCGQDQLGIALGP